MKKRRNEDDYAKTEVLERVPCGNDEAGAPDQQHVETSETDATGDSTVIYHRQGSSRR
jgi:hypothetical protein